MQSNHFAKSALWTLLFVTGFFACWEWYLRSKGIDISYDDGKELWAYKRRQVYNENATVFIGASRIKYGLDIPTWKKLTGEDAIQLAIDGASPLPILNDLAADEKFKGKVVIDIAESFLFSSKAYLLSRPVSYLNYYKNETPTEKTSFWLNQRLESQFVFLDRDHLSLNGFLDKAQYKLKPRGGVFITPPFPIGFCRVTEDRQSKMTDQFVNDSTQIKWVLGNFYALGGRTKSETPDKAVTDSFLTVIKNNIDKIKARGGKVILVRTPSTGIFWKAEEKDYPREKFWNRLVEVTNAPAIHFMDYEAVTNFNCPDNSHLTPKDAIVFTENLVSILEQKGWKFSKPVAVR